MHGTAGDHNRADGSPAAGWCMTRVHVIGTGGTIASTVDPDTGATVPALDAEDLLEQVPGLGAIAEIRSTEFSQVSSWNMTPALAADLARAIIDAFDGGADGVVVTHGTDTMEETAFVLDLLLGAQASADGSRPTVVVTGAMRSAGEDGADGPRNLLAASRVAAAPECGGLGGVVVMNDELHAARYVTKSHTTALDTFASPDTGPIGIVDGAGVLLRWRPVPLPPVEMCEPAGGVHLVKMAAGHEDLLLRAVRDGGARGVVIEGSGAGNVHAPWQPVIADLVAAGVPVVLASRCGAGRVVPSYGGDGGGHTLHDLGVIPARDLPGVKARLALMFVLGCGGDADDVRAWFARLDHVSWPAEPVRRAFRGTQAPRSVSA